MRFGKGSVYAVVYVSVGKLLNRVESWQGFYSELTAKTRVHLAVMFQFSKSVPHVP